MDNSVLIVGSLNIDVTLMVENFPKLGETIIGKSYYESCGGKGANQAVAVAALGLDASMLGKVGKDTFGITLLNNLKKYNIDTSYVLQDDCESGKAFIQVDKEGNNNIVVIPGCNFTLTPQEIDNSENAFLNCRAVILQNEIPMDTVLYVLKKAKKKNLLTVYNPAPAKRIDNEYIKYIDYLILNETELEEIFNLHLDDLQDKEKIFSMMLEKQLKNLIITVGEKGSIYITNSIIEYFSPFAVKAVDTTAAGDTFIGAFTMKILQGDNVPSAMKFANAASALAVSKRGAQESIPSVEEVYLFLNTNK